MALELGSLGTTSAWNLVTGGPALPFRQLGREESGSPVATFRTGLLPQGPSAQKILTGDGVTLAVVAGVWVVIALIALLAARVSRNKRITLEGNALSLLRRSSSRVPELGTSRRSESIGAGSSSRVLNLSDVERLEERRVEVGRTSYTASFAVLKDGKAAELFTEGQYPQQAQLKDAISAAAGKPWVTA